MSDKYFHDKVEEFMNMIDGCLDDGDEKGLREQAYKAFKEIARDQRYACAEALSGENAEVTFAHVKIINAEIKEK